MPDESITIDHCIQVMSSQSNESLTMLFALHSPRQFKGGRQVGEALQCDAEELTKPASH